MRDVNVWVVGVCLLALVAPLANAELVTINIEGVVDTVDDSGNYLEGQVNPGDIITGWYTYDTDTPDSEPALSTVGRYQHLSPPAGIYLTLGDFEFATDPLNVDFLVGIVNNSPSGGIHDEYALISYNNTLLHNGTSVDGISWSLQDDSAGALVNISLPTTVPVLSDWGSRNELRLDGERGGYMVYGHVTSAVPEPCTILLLGLGVLSLIRKIR